MNKVIKDLYISFINIQIYSVKDYLQNSIWTYCYNFEARTLTKEEIDDKTNVVKKLLKYTTK